MVHERGGCRGLRTLVGQPAGQRLWTVVVAGSSSGEAHSRVKTHPATRQDALD
jgi:hypothetical protein